VLPWVVVGVVVGVALAAGSGAFGAGRAEEPSIYQRAMQVAGEFRCPVCEGEAVSTSEAPEAVEIRDLIRGWLEEGRSEDQIRSYLVADYGGSVLERPPVSGLSAFVWVVPAAVVVLSAAGVGLRFRRWRRAGALAGPGRPPGSPPGGDRAELPGAELPGAEASHAEASQVGAGRVDRGPLPGRQRHRGRQHAMLVAGLALMAVAGVLWALDRSSVPRSAAGTATGGATGTAAELEQASSLASTDPAAALAVYGEVLASEPRQPAALAAEGWIYAEARFTGRAMGLLEEAEKADPGYGPAHLYRGLVLLGEEDRPAPAAAELKWYLSHSPTPALEAVAQQALREAAAAARDRAARDRAARDRAARDRAARDRAARDRAG
jgi:cytochrome c-type biogenesis protein CcmH